MVCRIENRNSTVLTLWGGGAGEKYSYLLCEETCLVHEPRVKNIEFEVFKVTMQ